MTSVPVYRRRLPVERQAIIHKFAVGSHKGYIIVGLYDDGQPGEIFIVIAKEGSTVAGLMGCLATSVSIGLQYGVPLAVLCSKFSHTRFEPSGWSGNADIGYANSITDYIFRWLEFKFLRGTPERAVPDSGTIVPNTSTVPAGTGEPPANVKHETSAPTCHDCGGLMVRSGACYACRNCGSTSGCS